MAHQWCEALGALQPQPVEHRLPCSVNFSKLAALPKLWISDTGTWVASVPNDMDTHGADMQTHANP